MPVIKIRRGTTTQWNASTRVLQVGELGIDTTLNRIKAGNGTNVWSALPYLSLSSAEIEELSQDAVSTALAAGTHSNITVTYSDNGNSISLATGPDVITQTSLSNTLTNPTTGYVAIGDVGQADGVASLDSNGKIPDSEIPATIARDSEIPSLTGYATETYVGTAISNLVASAPSTLNTLNELATALGNDANYASTITTALGNKEPLLPSQSGNSGKYLTTDGTAKSWATISQFSLPTQTSNSGKYLTTDGTNPSWATISGGASAATNTSLGIVYAFTQEYDGFSDYNLVPHDNTALGNQSLYSIYNGRRNIAVGIKAAYSAFNAVSNIAIGYNTLYSLSNMAHNIAIGESAAYSTNAFGNIAIGGTSLFANTTGEYNTVVGYQAMYSATGSNNIVLGYGANPSTTSTSNEITIGNATNNAFRIPGLAVNWTTSAYGRATYASTSAPSGGADGDVWLVYTP